MANIYIKLLEEFEPTGLSSRKSISPFMERHFKKPTATENDEWYRQNEGAHMFLQDIKHTGHFDFDEHDQFHVRFDFLTKEGRWYDIVNINARLTIAGMEFLEAHNVNKRVTENATKQTNILYLTALFTVCNLIFAIITLNFSDAKSTLQTQLQEQSKQIHKLQIELSESANLHFQELKAMKTLPKKK